MVLEVVDAKAQRGKGRQRLGTVDWDTPPPHVTWCQFWSFFEILKFWKFWLENRNNTITWYTIDPVPFFFAECLLQACFPLQYFLAKTCFAVVTNVKPKRGYFIFVVALVGRKSRSRTSGRWKCIRILCGNFSPPRLLMAFSWRAM